MFEDKQVDSPYIELLWQARPSQGGIYANIASEFWSLFFIDAPSSQTAYLVGPVATGRSIEYQAGSLYWGIVFKAHVFMTAVDKRALVGKEIALTITDNTIEVQGQSFQLPTFDSAVDFVNQLASANLITADEVVAKALSGSVYMSQRSVQRHVSRTVGLPQSTIIKVERARHAFMLLEEGKTISEVVSLAGYTDQAHLTKSLRLLAGMTPRQILHDYRLQ